MYCPGWRPRKPVSTPLFEPHPARLDLPFQFVRPGPMGFMRFLFPDHCRLSFVFQMVFLFGCPIISISASRKCTFFCRGSTSGAVLRVSSDSTDSGGETSKSHDVALLLEDPMLAQVLEFCFPGSWRLQVPKSVNQEIVLEGTPLATMTPDPRDDGVGRPRAEVHGEAAGRHVPTPGSEARSQGCGFADGAISPEAGHQ